MRNGKPPSRRECARSQMFLERSTLLRPRNSDVPALSLSVLCMLSAQSGCQKLQCTMLLDLCRSSTSSSQVTKGRRGFQSGFCSFVLPDFGQASRRPDFRRSPVPMDSAGTKM